MLAEPVLDKSVIDEKKEYYQGFINKEEFQELHKAKADIEMCNEALSKLDIEKLAALLQ